MSALIRRGIPIRSCIADVPRPILHDDERRRCVRYIPGRNVDGDLTLECLVLRRFGLCSSARASDGRGWEDFAFSRVHREADHTAFRHVGFIGERRIVCVGRRDPEIAIDVQTHRDERRRRRRPRAGWLRRRRLSAALRVQAQRQHAPREKHNNDMSRKSKSERRSSQTAPNEAGGGEWFS